MWDFVQFLGEIISASDNEPVPEQLYLYELNGIIQAVHRLDGHYLLYSLDDVDRALGAVRLTPGDNRLFLITNKMSERPDFPDPTVTLSAESGALISHGNIPIKVGRGNFYLTQVDLSLPDINILSAEQGLTLSVSEHDQIKGWWPVIIVQ